MWDFIANATVDDIESVPEENRSYYAEDKTAGKFVLKADVLPLAQALTTTQKNLAKANKTRTEDNKKDATRRTIIDGVKSTLAELGVEFEDDDITKLPEVVKVKFTELVESGKNGKENKVEIAKVRTAMETEKTKLVTAHAAEKAALMKSIEKLTIDNAAVAELAAAGTIESGPELLLPKIRSSVKVVLNDEGDYVARVIDADGTAKINSTGTEMTVKELIGDLKVKYPHMFKSTEKGGGGSKTNTNTQTVKKDDTKSSVDKIAAGIDSIKR